KHSRDPRDHLSLPQFAHMIAYMPTPDSARVRRASLARHRLGAKLQRFAASLAVAVLASCLARAAAPATAVVLPIEVVGENATTSSVVVDVPAQRAREVRSLCMQIHGLRLAGLASAQLHHSACCPLSNDAVTIS